MTTLTWNEVGERFFEAGLDRGVLYIEAQDGVAWNGLISVNESPVGGDPTPYYVDGVKYLNHPSREEFAATLEAYTYPDEFAQCDGMLSFDNGLILTQQRRKSFGLSYRTKVGNDVDGEEHGYKINIIYNAMVAPSARANTTIRDTVEPFNFSWAITTTPELLAGYLPTAHVVIDSRNTPESIYATIEAILYGDETNPPRLPTIDELVELIIVLEDLVVDAETPAVESVTGYDGEYAYSFHTALLDGGMS